MKLSDGEKLMLLMLCDMHKKVAPNGKTATEVIRSAILDDELWAIDWKYPGISFGDSADVPAYVREVEDILEVWWFVEDGCRHLEDGELQALQQTLGCKTLPKFTGFDGNSERRYMTASRYLIEKLDKYVEFKGRTMNSHCPLLENYRHMVHAFGPMRKHLSNMHSLNFDAIRTLLDAYAHAPTSVS